MMHGALDFCTRDVSWHGYEPTLMSSSVLPRSLDQCRGRGHGKGRASRKDRTARGAVEIVDTGVKCGIQLTSRSWEVEGGYRRDGSIAKHEWKGLGKGGLNRLEDWVEREKQEQGIVEEY